MSDDKNIDYTKIPLGVNMEIEESLWDTKVEVDPPALLSKGKQKSTSFPSEYTRPLVFRPMNQGSIGSCVGASGKVITTEQFGEETSALWIYQNAKKYDVWAGENYSGTSIAGACSAVSKVGVCSEKFFPYISSESAKPKTGAEEDAQKRMFKEYYGISLGQVSQIKELLQTTTLWTSFNVFNNFYQIDREGFIKEDGYLSSGKAGGHAMALVGWKEIDGKLFWKFQNSWGSYWGKGGFCYISHDLYSKVSKGVYYTVPFGSPNKVNKKNKFFQVFSNIFQSFLTILNKILRK